METILAEWVGLLLRWVHLVAGMAWIGASFYFMHIDASLRPAADLPKGKGGEAWEVHGGGFYHVRKYLLAPERLPDELIWHKWQSYATWLSGFALLSSAYYMRAELTLIDPAVRALTPLAAAAIGIGGLAAGWIVYHLLCRSPLGRREGVLAVVGLGLIMVAALGFQSVFSARGAIIHTGALMATLMSANVFLVIIPNQRKVIADLVAGRTPDPALGAEAKLRSTHNNYLTLPVVFLMLANHSPLAYSSRWAFVMVGLVLVAGALVRHFYNARHAGKGDRWWTWGLAALAMATAIALGLPSMSAAPAVTGAHEAAGAPVATATAEPVPESVANIVIGRCSMCHGAEPGWPGIAVAPRGVRLDTPGEIARQRDAIRLWAVLTHAMPPGNLTGLEPAERAELAAWTGIPIPAP